jgi:hypothetical protein
MLREESIRSIHEIRCSFEKGATICALVVQSSFIGASIVMFSSSMQSYCDKSGLQEECEVLQLLLPLSMI